MKDLNCRNIRRELEEATPGKWLSPDVNKHVSSCTSCETLLREQTKLRELVASLGTVEAPGDFNFRLRARLAEEKRARTQSFGLNDLSFGFRSAAVTAMLLVVGSAFIFVSFRNDSSSPTTAGKIVEHKPTNPVIALAPGSPVAGETGSKQPGVNVVDAGVKPQEASSRPAKRRNGFAQTALATARKNNTRSTDLSSMPATVLTRDQLAGGYPSPGFPIDGGYQSLKVSVDDVRGTSRTISLPTVSFGSQRALSQSGSPLMASARGDW